MADATQGRSVDTLEPIGLGAGAVDDAPIAFVDRLFVGHSLGRL